MHTTSVRWLIAVLLGTAGVPPVAHAATLPDATTAKTAIKCQRAIVQSGTKFVTGKLNGLQGCTGAILTCIQVKNASPQCLKAANKKCTSNLARILAAEAVFARTVTAACEKVSTADLAADIGLHYQLDEERCLADFAADVSTREGVVTCIVREHARTAERLFALQQARTVTLLEFAGVARNTLCDVPANPGGCDGCAVTNPPGSGKAVAGCAATVAKAGTAFAAKLIASLAKCTKATFACAATPATAEKMNACRLKAGGTCTAAFSTLAATRDAVDAKITNNKSCGAIPFGVLADVGGLNLEALAPGCATAVGGAFPSLTAYAQCLHQQHECRVDELAPFAVPRISELLGTVGLDDPFICAEPAPLTAIRIGAPLLAAAAEADGDLGAIIAAINSPGGIAQGTLTPGGFKPSTPGVSNSVTGASGTTTYRVAQPKPIKIAYTRCGDANLSPKLIVSVKNEGGALLPGFFELPLAKPAGAADVADVDVTFQPTVRSCVRLAFATECGDDVSPYVRFEQVPDIDPKETATPTPTPATTQNPSATGTPTVVPTPTTAGTPSATTLACGDVISGTLSPAGDVDLFSFSGQAGDKIALTMVSKTSFTTPKATVFSPSNAQLGGVVSANGTVEFTLAESGTHTVRVVQTQLTATGNYNIALACRMPLGPVDAVLACGDVFSGTLAPSGDSDFFTFTGQAGDKISLTMVSTTSGTTPNATVFSPSGAQLGGVVNATATVDFTLAESGTHTVRVVESPLTAATGGYNVALACRVPVDPIDATLHCGDVLSGFLTPAGDSDFFVFNGQAGDKISLTMLSATGGTTPNATVFSPSGAQLGGIINSNGSVDLTLAEAGTHTVRVVESPLFSTGGYSVALACRVPVDPVDATLHCDDVLSGSLTPAGDSDFFVFNGQAGDKVSLTMTSTLGSTKATVFSPSSAQVGGVVNANASVEFTLLESGTHAVRVVNSPPTGTADYNIALGCRKPLGPVETVLACGDVFSGMLTPAGDSDFFTFTGQAGDQISLTMISTTGGTTPNATVFSPSGAQLGGVVNSNGTVDLTLAESGTHTVRVVESPITVSAGGYNVALACRVPVVPVDATLHCGDVLSGSLTPKGDSDFYVFGGQAGDHVSLTMTSTTSGTTPTATVFSPGGAQLGGNVKANATVGFVLEVAGTHSVRIVQSPLTSTGNYNVGLSCP